MERRVRRKKNTVWRFKNSKERKHSEQKSGGKKAKDFLQSMEKKKSEGKKRRKEGT